MRKGITAGTFDLLHSGHVLMLAFCKTKCDHLTAALQLNPHHERINKNAPVQSIIERYYQLEGCKYVDSIVPYATEKDLVELLSTGVFDMRFIGEDWKSKEVTGADLNLPIYYTSRPHNYSSTNLRNLIKKQ